MSNWNYELIAILGPTASGKTQLATHLAKKLDGEIISADSRQVYRGMNLGTGKDYEDYTVDGVAIPYHLVDIVDAGYKYNVFEFQADFLKAFEAIKLRGKTPILCGGSGLYIESVVKGYRLMPVPENKELRETLSLKPDAELAAILASYKSPHNTTDLDTRKRTIRAIEIEEYYRQHKVDPNAFPRIKSIVFGVKYDRQTEMERIRLRLEQRLRDGMIDEVKALLNSGIPPDDLIYYGLEYKFLTNYVMGRIGYNEMFEGLYIAIRQFAKRQMTWFRGMERKGIDIRWINGELPLESKLDIIIKQLSI